MSNAVPGLPGLLAIFFDIGNRANLLAFFYFPELDVGPYAEVLGGLHHCVTSVEPALERDRAPHRRRRRGARDPQRCLGLLPRLDGARIELIADSLGQMYGYEVL
jgi:hypothetical protein